jgi:antitoxin (DNA-binding transcriptional repressor) of toxin-antitoxin stability system
MVVNVHQAKTNLSKLIAQVEAGEEVVIARNGKPAVRLSLATVQAETTGKRVLGGLRGKLKLPPDWEERWKEMDAEIERDFNGPIFPDGTE